MAIIKIIILKNIPSPKVIEDFPKFLNSYNFHNKTTINYYYFNKPINKYKNYLLHELTFMLVGY